MEQQSQNRCRLSLRLLALGAAAGLVLLDQYLKRLVDSSMLPLQHKHILPGFLRLHYTQNTGISFSLLNSSPGAMGAVSVLTAAVMLAGIFYILSGRVRQAAPLCAAALIIAGGTGNLIDRLLRGFVVDYLEFEFVQFAVFNFADALITCGVAVLAGWVIWEDIQHRKRARGAKMP